MLFKTPPDTNTLLVLRAIWLHPRISRTDIAKIIGLDQSTVSRIVSSFLDTGIVQVADEGHSGPQGGRKPVYLQVNEAFGCVVGIELQSEEYTIVGINLLGEIIFSETQKYAQTEQSIPTLFFGALQRAYALVAVTKLDLLGIGVGLPGIIDSHNGIIIQSNPLEVFDRMPFLESIAPMISVPIRIEHDARCCCWAELAFHRGRCPANFLYMLGEFRRNRLVHSGFDGIAVGMGLVFANRVYTGEDFAAGEFRSVFYKEHRKNQIFAIDDDDLERLQSDLTIQERFAHELGRNLALLVNVLNLTKVFVGGSIESLGDNLLNIMRQEVEDNWLYRHQTNFEIDFTQLGDNAVAYGAAGMFLEHIFAPPESSPSMNELISRLNRYPVVK